MGAILLEHRPTILQQAATGSTLKDIAGELGVDRHTLWTYRQAHPEFDRQLQRALVEGAYSFLDDARALFLNLSDRDNPIMARVKLEAIRFYLEKRFPKEFAERKQIDIRAVVDLAPALERARQRLAHSQVIDITPTTVTLPSDQRSVATENAAEIASMLE